MYIGEMDGLDSVAGGDAGEAGADLSGDAAEVYIETGLDGAL